MQNAVELKQLVRIVASTLKGMGFRSHVHRYSPSQTVRGVAVNSCLVCSNVCFVFSFSGSCGRGGKPVIRIYQKQRKYLVLLEVLTDFVVCMLRLLKDIPWIHTLDISRKVVSLHCGTFHSPAATFTRLLVPPLKMILH
jgi:hypothetical protein